METTMRWFNRDNQQLVQPRNLLLHTHAALSPTSEQLSLEHCFRTIHPQSFALWQCLHKRSAADQLNSEYTPNENLRFLVEAFGTQISHQLHSLARHQWTRVFFLLGCRWKSAAFRDMDISPFYIHPKCVEILKDVPCRVVENLVDQIQCLREFVPINGIDVKQADILRFLVMAKHQELDLSMYAQDDDLSWLNQYLKRLDRLNPELCMVLLLASLTLIENESILRGTLCGCHHAEFKPDTSAWYEPIAVHLQLLPCCKHNLLRKLDECIPQFLQTSIAPQLEEDDLLHNVLKMAIHPGSAPSDAKELIEIFHCQQIHRANFVRAPDAEAAAWTGGFPWAWTGGFSWASSDYPRFFLA